MEEIEMLANALRGYLEDFIKKPTAEGYHLLRGKIAEYSNICVARTQEKEHFKTKGNPLSKAR